MKERLPIKHARVKTIMVLVIIGSLYGFISAIRNQNPYYPAVGSKVESEALLSELEQTTEKESREAWEKLRGKISRKTPRETWG